MSDERERFLIRYSRGFAPFIVARASGAWLQTEDGQHILDFTSGQICSTIGHNHPRIVEAVQQSLEEVIHLNSWMLSQPVLELAERLASLLPASLNKVILVNTGGEANEIGLRIAKMHTGRFEVVGLTRSWHGLQTGTASLNLAGGHSGYGPLMPGSLTLPAPYAYRCPIRHCKGTCDCSCLDAGFDLIDKQSVGSLCAVIAEPVLSAGGVIVPPPEYFQRLRQLCEEHEMLLILDEAQTGFGRLGTMFGCEKLGFKPQAISVAKALSSAYLPIAAVMIPELTYEALLVESKKLGAFGHGFTYGGHPVSAAVAVKAIEIYQRDRIIEKAARRAPLFQARLKALGEHPLIGEARGLGLIGGLELVADKTSKRSFDAQHGVGAAARFARSEA